MFIEVEQDEDTEMGGMESSGGLSTRPHLRPSQFITSVGQQVTFYQNTAQLSDSTSYDLKETKPLVKSTFQPSYSHKSENWREEICFKNAASAEVHYGKGLAERSFSEPNKRKQEEIEVPYSFHIDDEDLSTESDPDDREEVIVSTGLTNVTCSGLLKITIKNIFETKELPGRRTRGGKEVSLFFILANVRC
jgi:hypothetical protein